MKHEPSLVSAILRDTVHRFSLFGTLEEQRTRLLRNSNRSTHLSNPVPDKIARAVLASLALHPRTPGIDVFFVKGEDTGTDLLYNPEDHLRIHENWLNMQTISEIAGCQLSVLASVDDSRVDTFHVVEGLFDCWEDNDIRLFCGSDNYLHTSDLERWELIYQRSTCRIANSNSLLMGLDDPINDSTSASQTNTSCGCIQQIEFRGLKGMATRELTSSESYHPMMVGGPKAPVSIAAMAFSSVSKEVGSLSDNEDDTLGCEQDWTPSSSPKRLPTIASNRSSPKLYHPVDIKNGSTEEVATENSQQEEDIWRSWHQRELSETFKLFISERALNEVG